MQTIRTMRQTVKPQSDKEILRQEGDDFVRAAILLLQEWGQDGLRSARALLDNAQEAYDFSDEADEG